ncbi:MAG: complex I subunit 5 family protein [Hydrogenovibrio sp.]|uniref:complex I subunit 5 family protein n=1 Tax=Hydrogenovibrio sp. TaxID=2065821 RepID=UPI0028701B41|nr:complex I subunit 5 family protein [Hydrogenovibrio sp.]MDR9499157.1 complex I subunit 5 family protein [Hydrogenovibrio sp.]
MSSLMQHMIGWVWLWPLGVAVLLAWPLLRRRAMPLLLLALLPGWALWGLAWGLPDLAMGKIDQAWSFWLLGSQWRLDALSHSWLGLTLVVWTLAALHSLVMVSAHQARYALFFLLSLSGSLLWVLAADAVSFYLGFSLMSLSAWGLVIHEGSRKAQRAGRWYLVLALIGELTLFVGVVARAAETGTTTLSDWSSMPDADWVLICLWLGLAIKVGVPLLHVWLPLAHPAAPVPASAVLSGVMIKAGVIGWWLLLPSEMMAQTAWPEFMLWLGVLTMFYGAVFGLMQSDPKTLLAYSSISQMGWLIWGLGWVWQMGTPEAGMLWLSAFALHHGLVKGGLFLSVGWVKQSVLMAQPGLRTATWIGVGVLALVLAGLPLTSGDWVKTALKAEADNAEAVVPSTVLWLGGLATALLMVRFVTVLRGLGGHKPTAAGNQTLTTRMIGVWFSWVALVGLVLVWPWWQTGHWGTGHVWSGSVQGLASVVTALLLVWLWRRLRWPEWEAPPGDVLVGYQWLGAHAHKVFKQRHRSWRVRKRLAARRWRHWQTARLLKSHWRTRWETRFADWRMITGGMMLIALLIGLSVFSQ